MLWDALIELPTKIEFLANMLGFIALVLVGGSIWGFGLLALDLGIFEIPGVEILSSAEADVKWVAANEWVEIPLFVRKAVPAEVFRVVAPGRRLKGVPEMTFAKDLFRDLWLKEIADTLSPAQSWTNALDQRRLVVQLALS